MSTEEAPRPVLRVVRGDADAEELAALVAVLAAAGGAGGAAGQPPAPARSRWAAREMLVRRPVAPGPGAWRASGAPQ